MKLKTRNRVALAAWNRSGAGRHTDRKKEARRRYCRGKGSKENN